MAIPAEHSSRNSFRLWVNDEAVEVRDLPPTRTLLEFLRTDLRLTGTKEGCAEGDCGACTVVILDENDQSGPRYRAINSCLVLLPMVRGRRVYTVEALAEDGRLHPAQEALVEKNGSQCGFCTPGVVMSMFEATYRSDLDEEWKLENQMAGNLCRCTGYRPIREAAALVAGTSPKDRFQSKLCGEPAHSSLCLSDDVQGAYLTSHGSFYAPRTFEALFDVLLSSPSPRIVSGSTDVGLLVTKAHEHLPCLVSLEEIPALKRLECHERALVVGASVPLTDLERESERSMPPLALMLRDFASRQIKHRATMGGNLCNASPVGDLAPVLMALGATCIARSKNGSRGIKVDEFFVSYRKTALRDHEILEAIEIPAIEEGTKVAAYKVSKRREVDISSVSGAFFVQTDARGIIVEQRLAFGGMADRPARAHHAEAALNGRPWSRETVEAAAAALEEDFEPIDDLRASAWYRRKVAGNLLLRFFLEHDQSARQPESAGVKR